MLIGIISDIHDRLENLDGALEQIRAAGAEALICCGDLCSPFVVPRLSRWFPDGPITIVFGNNDGDRYRITSFAMREMDGAGKARIEVAGESATVERGGKRIFVHHFHEVGALVAAGGQFDVVCCGHNHDFKAERHPGGGLEINPGAIMGWHPTREEIAATYALYDTDRHEVRVIAVDSGAVVAAAG